MAKRSRKQWCVKRTKFSGEVQYLDLNDSVELCKLAPYTWRTNKKGVMTFASKQAVLDWLEIKGFSNGLVYSFDAEKY